MVIYRLSFHYGAVKPGEGIKQDCRSPLWKEPWSLLTWEKFCSSCWRVRASRTVVRCPSLDRVDWKFPPLTFVAVLKVIDVKRDSWKHLLVVFPYV